jgi:hypothetical protein
MVRAARRAIKIWLLPVYFVLFSELVTLILADAPAGYRVRRGIRGRNDLLLTRQAAYRHSRYRRRVGPA